MYILCHMLIKFSDKDKYFLGEIGLNQKINDLFMKISPISCSKTLGRLPGDSVLIFLNQKFKINQISKSNYRFVLTVSPQFYRI
jgi:hypothetical protein